MSKWKSTFCGAACALILASGILPVRAVMPQTSPQIRQSAENHDFQNPHGMTVDLIYIHVDADGKETIVKTVKRAIIPAGTSAITLEMQQQLLPEGWKLSQPEEQPLQEDTMKIRIPVEPVKDPEEKPVPPTESETQPQDPTVPETQPEEPTEKPTEPQKPDDMPTESQKPAEKPAEPQKPDEKPTEPQNPNKPAAKPEKPSKKPDTTNPKTGDSFSPAAWIFPGAAAGSILLLLRKRKTRRS